MEDLGKNLTEQMQRNNWNERYQKLITEILQDTEVRTFLAENSQTLTQADVMKSASKLYEFVTLKKQIAQGKQTLHPAIYRHLRSAITGSKSCTFLQLSSKLGVSKKLWKRVLRRSIYRVVFVKRS